MLQSVWRSGAGMSGGVGLLEAFGGEMGVDLGGDEVGVAEQFLDAAKIGPRIKHVGGKAVAQLVRGHCGVETAVSQIALEPELNQARINGR